MATPTLVPDGFLKQVLDEFGVQWTHIAVLSGAMLSVFGLERYLNAGVWILVTIAAFCAVFIFRRQISGNFPRAVLFSASAVVFLILAPLLYLRRNGTPIPDWIQDNRLAATTYMGAAVMLPLAYLILSYRVQEEQFGGPYPKQIRAAIRAEVVELPFYRKDQVYSLEVLNVDGDLLTMRMDLSYVLVNRTKSARESAPGVAPGLRKITPRRVVIGGKDIDLADPEIMTERGMRVARTFPANSETDVRFVVDVEYRVRDNDLYTSWLPVTNLTLKVTNEFPVSFHFEHLMQGRVDPMVDGATTTYHVDRAVLPYQGFRMTWMSKKV